MQLAEGMVVANRFRLGQMLGRGGMGSVWRAMHLGLDVPCAVKFIEGELASLPEAQARFEREAKAAAQLRSPHVVQILDHGVWDGTPYIAMELLEGEDLGKRLARVGRLSPPDTHNIISQVCRALAKAHATGIVHRDLKPDNIFLVRDDDREITKVLDFGIAKSRGQDLGGSSNTKTGAMLGTPYYMSPEQAQGIKQVDFRTDLWALAVIVYQSLTGRLPFESEALGDLLVRIIVAPLPVPSQIAPVPPGFDAWWAKAASRDPNERFQSAKEVADSLSLVCGVSQASGILDVRAAQGAPPQPVASVGTGAPMSRTVPGVPSSGSRLVLAGGIGVAALAVLGIGGVALWKMSAPASDPPKAAATAVAAPRALPEAPKEVRLVETMQPKEAPAPASASAAEPPAPTPPTQPVAAAAPAPASPSPGTSKKAQPAAPVNHPAASAATSKSNKASYNAGF
jgi:serine/threonine-protein kinase